MKNQMSFTEWKRQLDEICWKRYDLSIDDLADVPMMDWWEDGVSPKSAASRARKFSE